MRTARIPKTLATTTPAIIPGLGEGCWCGRVVADAGVVDDELDTDTGVCAKSCCRVA